MSLTMWWLVHQDIEDERWKNKRESRLLRYVKIRKVFFRFGRLEAMDRQKKYTPDRAGLVGPWL